MNSKITVSGNIIGELSEKIPSNIIALNELLKNSYDAGASKVTIILDSSKKTLMIIDDGSGMDKNDIDTLFHISNSTKKYGQINEYGRYTQGSKGLGFLSVFKFGRYVEWKTKKETGLTFKVDYNSLIGSNDISQYEIEVVEDNTIAEGTSITILLDEYNANSLESYFSIEKNYKKVLNAFDDAKFIVDLQINGMKYSSRKTLPLTSNAKEHQLYYVKYNNEEQKIKLLYNGYEIMSEDYLFTSKEYKLEIELIIFQFPPYGKGKVDQLFLNPQDDLTPLIYVNANLFNNYDLFDPNVMKNIKTTQVLNQMIGFVRIISDDSKINFNSDRTQFLQNELTDSIRKFLSDMNKRIQVIGSQNKKYLMDFDILTVSALPSECNDIVGGDKFRKYVKSDFSFRSEVAIKRKGDKVSYSLFGKEKILYINAKANASSNGSSGVIGRGKNPPQNDNPPSHNPQGDNSPIPAVINFNCDHVKLSVPTGQVDLKKYIASVYDSNGTIVDKNLLAIKNDGILVDGGILSSVMEPCEKYIAYSYTDPRTGSVVKTLHVIFYRPEAEIVGKSKEGLLISLPAQKSYTINYNNYVDKLIRQINSLNQKDYLELISCSLRAIFDLSIDSINKSGKFNTLFNGVYSFEDRVVKVVDYIRSNKAFKEAISKSAKIDFHSLGNMLDSQRFRSGISMAHLGAHKSGTYISESDIIQLGKLLGIFVVVVNEMLQNNSIN